MISYWDVAFNFIASVMFYHIVLRASDYVMKDWEGFAWIGAMFFVWWRIWI